jgi:hypothetical protein
MVTDAYQKAQIEQLEMICARLETDVDNLRIEIGRLKAGVHLQHEACSHDNATINVGGNILTVDCPKCGWKQRSTWVSNHPGESWQTEDVEQ